jgi:uncharacterized protein YbjT (DUF2867 family)
VGRTDAAGAKLVVRGVRILSAILVTGSSGQVGGALVDELVRRGEHIRAMVRTEERADDLAARGVDAVIGDLERPESLLRVLDGVSRVFLMSRDDPGQPEMEGALIEAAARAGVERIVKLSASGARPDNPVALMRRHARVERILEGSGLGYTILRPQLFMQNFLRFGPTIAAEGRFAAPMDDRRFAFVDVRDVAHVAATALIEDEDAHVGVTYVVSGPGALSYVDAAQTIGATIGKEVAYEPAEPRAFLDDLVAERGLPRWRADELAFIASAYDEGAEESVTDVVRRVGGAAPRTFAEFVKDYADHFTRGLSHHI